MFVVGRSENCLPPVNYHHCARRNTQEKTNWKQRLRLKLVALASQSISRNWHTLYNRLIEQSLQFGLVYVWLLKPTYLRLESIPKSMTHFMYEQIFIKFNLKDKNHCVHGTGIWLRIDKSNIGVTLQNSGKHEKNTTQPAPFYPTAILIYHNTINHTKNIAKYFLFHAYYNLSPTLFACVMRIWRKKWHSFQNCHFIGWHLVGYTHVLVIVAVATTSCWYICCCCC